MNDNKLSDIETLQLTRTYNKLKHQYTIHKIILEGLRSLKTNYKNLSSNDTDIDKLKIEKLLKTIIIKDYIKSDNKSVQINALDITFNYKQLSYRERTFIFDNCCLQIPKIIMPCIKFIREIKNEPIHNVFEIENVKIDICTNETKRRQHVEKLLKLKKEKIVLLINCIDMKCNSQQKYDSEIMHMQAQKCQIKASIMKNLAEQIFVSRDKHSKNAIKEVKNYVDATLHDLSK